MNSSTPENQIQVLIVEDNPVDLYFLQQALKTEERSWRAIAVDDGEPALRFLRRDKPYENEPPPDLVILDLNLRRVDGREVLSYIRVTPALRETPVAIVSSSPTDLMRSENLLADCYVRKPSDLDAFLGIGKILWQCYLEKRARP
jgi:CheY-like chemotaxis protein